jgi:predicted GTPase
MGITKSKPTLNPDQDQYILVMGVTGAGKTTVSPYGPERHILRMLTLFVQFINKVSGSSHRVSDDILSCTLKDQITKSFNYGGRRIRMIDTAGFEDSDATDAELRLSMFLRLTKL